MTTLTICLRSGNQLRLPHIQDWKIRTVSKKVAYLEKEGSVCKLAPLPETYY
jgi:hypothetical protein